MPAPLHALHEDSGGEKGSGRELPFGIERLLHSAHLPVSLLSIQLPEQRLFHGVAAHTVFGQWTPSPGRDDTAALQYNLLRGLHVLQRMWDKIGMHVAVRDMTPDGVVEPALCERFAEELHHIPKACKGHDHIGGNLCDVRMHQTLAPGHTLIDPHWHRLA